MSRGYTGINVIKCLLHSPFQSQISLLLRYPLKKWGGFFFTPAPKFLGPAIVDSSLEVIRQMGKATPWNDESILLLNCDFGRESSKHLCVGTVTWTFEKDSLYRN